MMMSLIIFLKLFVYFDYTSDRVDLFYVMCKENTQQEMFFKNYLGRYKNSFRNDYVVFFYYAVFQ